MSPLTRAVHGLTAIAVSAALLPLQAIAAIPFTDVPTSGEFAVYIDSLYNEGVISGVTPTTFEPMRNMTRGEVAKVIVKAKAMPINTNGGPHFSDVAATNSFFSYIETLYNAGIISGYGNGTFGVSNPVTRGEFSKMLSKTFMIPVDLTGAPHFSDVPASNEFYQFVETLKNNSIISGYGNGTFGPSNKILRQEVAKMVDRTMKLAKVNGFNPGTGARLDVQSTAAQIVANCYSTTSITVTSYDKFGNVDESFTDNVTVKATLGKFSGSGLDQETQKAQTGRASFTITSCTAGTSNVTASATGFASTTIEVRFTEGAQGPNQGKGPVCVTGTGCMDASIVSDKLLPAVNEEPGVAGDLRAFLGGQALVQIYLYDSNGDSMDLGGAAIRCTIISGTGALTAPGAFTGTPAGAEVRSLFLNNEGNGRYIANYGLIAGQIPGTVKLECTDLLASPALTTSLTVDMKPIVVKTWVADNTLTAAPEPATGNRQGRTAIFATLTDQYGDPRTLTCGAVSPMDLEVRVVAGPSDATIDSTPGGVANRLRARPSTGGGDTYLQGLYTGRFIAGNTPGTSTIEVRATDCIGQPRATTTITVSEPKLELFASSLAFGGPIDGQSNLTRIIARLVNQDGKPINGETLVPVIESGPPAALSASPMNNVGAAQGFYTTNLTLTAVPATGQPIVVRVTDTDRIGSNGQPLQATITIQANPSNLKAAGTAATSMTLLALRSRVGAGQTDSFVVMLRDSRRSGVPTACGNVALPTAVVGQVAAIASVGGTADGMCFYNVTFGTTVGNVRIQARYTPVTGVPLVQEISFDVRDNTVTLEPISTKLTFGDGSGAIVYVRDEVGDSVNGLAAGAFNTQVSDTRILPGAGAPIVNEIGALGSYVFTYHIPQDIAASNFNVRTTLLTPAAVTNPTDSFTVNASPVTITLKAHPGSVLTGRCIILDAIVKNASGAPLTNGLLNWEIASATGGNGTLTAGNNPCPAGGTTTVLGVTDNGTVTNDGVYIVTYEASSIASTDTVRAYLPNTATTPEATVTVTSR